MSLDDAHSEPKAEFMTRKVITVAVNGVSGRMGYRQHLVRSLLSIRDQGGVRLDDGTSVYPEPILVGRSEERLRAIAERHGLQRWTTSLEEVLADRAILAPGGRGGAATGAMGGRGLCAGSRADAEEAECQLVS